MNIKRIISQHRRDFTAEYECEHCGHTHTGTGYDDTYFHTKVVLDMECEKCGKTADSSYKARATKYPDGMQV